MNRKNTLGNLAYIALGSNLDNPKQQVLNALDKITADEDISIIKISSIYETAPVGYDNQPHFINAVIEIKTSLTPLALLRRLLQIEIIQGRERPFPNAPRVIDLDLLIYNEVQMQTPELTLPHPRMHERGFVMLPFSEIAPDVLIGEHGFAKILAQRCEHQGVVKL